MKRLLLAVAIVMLAGCDATPMVPQDVRDFVQRSEDCRHWTGEEGYDAARRAQINAAYETLRCAALEADEQALKRHYGNDPALLRVLDEARRPAP